MLSEGSIFETEIFFEDSILKPRRSYFIEVNSGSHTNNNNNVHFIATFFVGVQIDV